MKKPILFITLFFIFFLTACSDQKEERISYFPLEKYNQSIDSWLPPDSPNDNKPLLAENVQHDLFTYFLKKYIGTSSPWDGNYINKILQLPSPDDLKSTEMGVLQLYNNKNQDPKTIGYGENYLPYSSNWIDKIANNIDLNKLTHLTFDPKNRGIAIDNLHVRSLPTDDVFFYSHKIAGQGFPFDNLQMSSLWAGSPLYVVCQTKDKAWSLIIAADFIGWVKSNGIATVNAALYKNLEKGSSRATHRPHSKPQHYRHPKHLSFSRVYWIDFSS